MTDTTAFRDTMRNRIYAYENTLVPQLIEATGLDAAQRQSISGHAEKLVTAVRTGNKLGLMESFLAEYGLATDEGVALMSLAEALLPATPCLVPAAAGDPGLSRAPAWRAGRGDPQGAGRLPDEIPPLAP